MIMILVQVGARIRITGVGGLVVSACVVPRTTSKTVNLYYTDQNGQSPTNKPVPPPQYTFSIKGRISTKHDRPCESNRFCPCFTAEKDAKM